MNRVERSKTKYKQLFCDGVPAAYATGPEFQDIMSRFIFGEVFEQNLDDKQRHAYDYHRRVKHEEIPDEKYNHAKETKACLTKL